MSLPSTSRAVTATCTGVSEVYPLASSACANACFTGPTFHNDVPKFSARPQEDCPYRLKELMYRPQMAAVRQAPGQRIVSVRQGKSPASNETKSLGLASAKPFKAADFDGLYITTCTSGSRLWHFKYNFSRCDRLNSPRKTMQTGAAESGCPVWRPGLLRIVQ